MATSKMMRPMSGPCANAARSLALVALLGLSGCGGGDEPGGAAATPAANTPTPAPAVATAPPAVTPPAAAQLPAAEGPRITFASLVHDFGVITDTTTHNAAFSFTNTGNATLVISDIKAACGCTVPTLRKRQFAPGEGGEIEIVFDPKGKQGPTPKNITVISNARPESTVKLQLVSDIKPLLRFERMQRLGTLPLHQETRRNFTFTYTDPNLELRRLSFNNPHLTANIVEQGNVASTSSEGPVYEVVIEVVVSADAPWGLIYATRLTMDVYGSPNPGEPAVSYTYDMFMTGDIYGEIHAQRALVSLGQISPGGSYEKKTTIFRPSGAPFEVTSSRVTESTIPGLTVRVEPVGMASYDVILAGDVGSFMGSMKGVVELMTDVEGEGPLTIRFAGLVR